MKNEAHVIRLRGPWHVEPLARVSVVNGQARWESSSLPLAARQQLPNDWSAVCGAAFRGRVRYRRGFGRPTNLASAKVWLVCSGVDYQGEFWLNGTRLGAMQGWESTAEWAITELLLVRNELVVEVTCMADEASESRKRGNRAGMAGGLIGEARLEIRGDG
jgi:beta-galactosidase/beta-glucuronidase